MNASKLTTLCAALLVASLAACDANDDDLAASPDLVPPATTEPAVDMPPAGTDLPPAGGEGVLTVATHGDGGTYVADSAGNAVYLLEVEGGGDGDTVEACVGDCLETWPPVLVTDVQPSIDLGANLDAGLLGTVERDDGTLQLTYNGHPLYRYAADTGANRTAGHGIEDQWGHWYLVAPAGVEFEAEMGTAADAGMVEDADAEPAQEDTGDDY